MSNDYGSDFSAVEDVDPYLTFLDGALLPLALTEALARKFDVPRGGLFYDPAYGLSLSQFLLDSIDTQIAEQAIVGEALKDERVASCKALITVQPDGGWKIQINPKDEAGKEYELVFLAGPSKVSLLALGQV
jgi:hypothetical protein